MDFTLQSIKQRFGIIGRSAELDRAISTAMRVAGTDLTVLITGESGVGKEAISKIIHALSGRKHNEFIAINCGAIPEGTINSELFGHDKGAFTGATSDRKGYFETVNGGTIFLDEIGEMPLDTQSFLLRILETGEFIRVGSSKVMTTDVRVVAATNVNLEEKIKLGKFREDLFYRLNTVPIRMPALRDRQEDVYMIFRKFIVDFAEKYNTPPLQVTEDARALLEQYTWPGNIRELKNVAEQLSVLSESRMVTSEQLLSTVPSIAKRNLPALASHSYSSQESFQEREILYKLLFEMKHDLNELKSLVFELIRSNDLQISDIGSVSRLLGPPSIQAQMEDRYQEFVPKSRSEDAFKIEKEKSYHSVVVHPVISDGFESSEVLEDNLSLEEMEKDMIRKALKKFNGRRKEASSELGISERTLYRKIKQYDIPE
jgi:DNA-binding NtrC family response regulator